MLQLYKQRDFGALISDTITFFKDYGRNFFKNFLIINGFVTLLFVVLFVLGYREIFSSLLKNTGAGQVSYFENLLNENQFLFIGIGIVFFLLLLLVMLLNFVFPVLYMKRLAETGDKNITSDQILEDLKKNKSKIFKFFLGLFFIITPIAFLLLGLSFALVMIFIGIFVVIIIMPAMMNIINFSLFDYLHTQKSFFESVKTGLDIQFSNFWKYLGSCVITYFIINIVMSAFTMIPMMIFMATSFTVPTDGSQPDFDKIFGIGFFIIYAISILASFISMNVLYVNAGLMYYDGRKDLHRNIDLHEIDNIGSGE